MTRSGWVILLSTLCAQLALIAATAWACWDLLDSSQQTSAVEIVQRAGGALLLGTVALCGLIGAVMYAIFSRWVRPLGGFVEALRLIALSNPRHRVSQSGTPEIGALAIGINLLAQRFQSLHDDVDERIREANALIEEEKTILITLMSKLTQGVLVCNLEGRILLYNRQAQRLLERSAGQSEGHWIGLGRTVYGAIDENVIRHSLENIRHRLDGGETNLMVPFVAPRPGGQMLSAQFIPIVDHEKCLSGYILTFLDVTRQFDTESRRGVLLQSLTEGQRSAIGGIRAAIETVLAFPEMDEAGRQQFFEVIRDEALKVSGHLDRLEVEYAEDLTIQLPFEDILGSDLLATLERNLEETRGVVIEVSAPVEPVWLKIESYAVIQCLLFLVDQLIAWCRAEDMQLTLAAKRALASFELQWSGAALDMEALRNWGIRNVTTDPRGTTKTLFEAIEQYGGVIWADRSAATGRPCVRLILPTSDLDVESGVRADDDYGHDFDFHLFGQRSETRDLMSVSLDRLSVTVLDVETTGLDPDNGDEIIAIGAVRIVNGRILRQENFDSFVHPKGGISLQSQAIHGITASMLRGEPPIEDVLPRLRRFVEDTVIVGHNVDFDMRFFAVAGSRLGVSFDRPVLDTLLLECAINPNHEDKSLEAIAARLGKSVTGRHTALGDALTTAEIFVALQPLLAQNGIRTLGEAISACRSSPYARLTA
ncbi:MAG: DNA polymerase III subunit epsilon [Rhodospirillales bacterium]|nr:DNA polymerase III subunit epsilon [Rhodospirillales bacterium]